MIALFGGVVLVQLIRLQVVEHEHWSAIGRVGQTGVREVEPERGRIWDRNGALLAGNEPRFQVWIDRVAAENSMDIVARDIAPMLGLQPDAIRAALNGAQARVMLKTDVTVALGTQLLGQSVFGLEVVAYWRRDYPERALAASVLGFYNAEHKGYYGVEGFYDGVLAGEKQVFEVGQDVWRDPLPLTVPPETLATTGADLVLTIDRTVQMIVEEELARALETTGAQSGTIIVMDPRTGEILAMASLPGYDPNTYTDTASSDPKRFVNPAVSGLYEPGSVFKIITLAAALDSGMVTPETTYEDTACLEVGGQTLCNWDRKEHGVISMVDMMAKSLNVGAATLSTRMGAQTFYHYVRAFGFSQLTGIDLQAEAAGSVRVPTDVDWYESDLGTNAFGQGLSATPLQVITAVAAAANEGRMVRPHVVKAIAEVDRVREAQLVEIGRPIRPETAHTLTAVLAEAVLREVPQAQVPGYRIAGKTGTAQIPIPGGYDDPWTIGSFVGYGPASDPQLIILTRLDRPTVSPWGSNTAAPLFQRVATRLFKVLGIPPDDAAVASGP
ncbi:MAG TPA: penicillin-binding protein 2 [Anaerolineae bacterium]|nr:penicillin-binding protein 2 [Anaerolineae bacterium]